MSKTHSFEVTKEFFDHLSELTYDAEGEVAWPKHLDDFLAFLGNEEDFNEL